MVETDATGRTFPGWEDVAEDIIPDIDDLRDLGSASKKWAAAFIVLLAITTSITIGGVVSLSTIDSWLFINASTWINESLNVSGNITAANITADYYFGNGSQLTDITLTELDPYWTGNQSSYFNITDILGFDYYNSTDFDIADYLNLSTLLSFGYYNSTDFSISDYFTKSDILGFSYYNSTDFSIADYSTTASILGWNYWNDTYATFNKTYADTLYLTAESDPIFTAWDNFTGIPHAAPSDGDVTHFSWADEIYDWAVGLFLQSYTETDPLWTGNETNVAFKNEVNVFTANQNLTTKNISTMDCIIFDSGGTICSGV